MKKNTQLLIGVAVLAGVAYFTKDWWMSKLKGAKSSNALKKYVVTEDFETQKFKSSDKTKKLFKKGERLKARLISHSGSATEQFSLQLNYNETLVSDTGFIINPNKVKLK